MVRLTPFGCTSDKIGNIKVTPKTRDIGKGVDWVIRQSSIHGNTKCSKKI
jgi:hypothetical protein